jgi:hypothetical protein
MSRRFAHILPLLFALLLLIAFPAEAHAQDGDGAKSSLIGYVIVVLGFLLGWAPLARPSGRKKKFSFET